MKPIPFACLILCLLSACTKQIIEPVPGPEAAASVDKSHPKKAVTDRSNGYTRVYNISTFSYTEDGSLASIISYDSLYPAIKDSILFSYSNGKISRKMHTGWKMEERFTYTNQQQIETYSYKNPSGEKTYRYFYGTDGTVSHLLAFDATGAMVDSIVVNGNHTVSYLGKDGNPDAYSQAYYRYLEYQDYFISDYGIYASGAPMGFSNIQTVNPFQPELSSYLLEDQQVGYPYQGIYHMEEPRTFCKKNPLGFEGYYFFDSYGRLDHAGLYRNAYTQSGSAVPDGWQLKLYY